MNKATAYSSLSIKSVGPLYFEHRSELILLNVLHWDQLVWMTGLKEKWPLTILIEEDNSLAFFFFPSVG